jgi:hypothetical protein
MVQLDHDSKTSKLLFPIAACLMRLFEHAAT